MSFITYKNNKILLGLCAWGILIVGGWCIRNIIISGYLIYPIYQIDLFSFDWKMPRDLLIMQSNVIGQFPKIFWHSAYHTISTLNYEAILVSAKFYLYLCLSVVALFSFLIFLYKLLIRKIRFTLLEYAVFLSGFLTFALMVVKGADIRFMLGTILGLSVYTVMEILKKDKNYKQLGSFILSAVVLLSIVQSIRSLCTRYYTVYYYEDKRENIRPASTIFFKPYPAYLFADVSGRCSMEEKVKETTIDGHLFYETVCEFSMYKFPTVVVYEESIGRLVDYKCVEMRGETLDQGFRTNKSCFDKSTINKYGDRETNLWLRK